MSKSEYHYEHTYAGLAQVNITVAILTFCCAFSLFSIFAHHLIPCVCSRRKVTGEGTLTGCGIGPVDLKICHQSKTSSYKVINCIFLK